LDLALIDVTPDRMSDAELAQSQLGVIQDNQISPARFAVQRV